MNRTIKVIIADWDTCSSQAAAVRNEVFVHEQHVPQELELDDQDAHCVHALAYDEHGECVGTGRLLPDAHIGRMAVRKPYRGLGVGSLLLTALMDEARRRHHPEVALAAQVRAQAFYAVHGFVPEGDTFMDAGIKHITMRRVFEHGKKPLTSTFDAPVAENEKAP